MNKKKPTTQEFNDLVHIVMNSEHKTVYAKPATQEEFEDLVYELYLNEIRLSEYHTPVVKLHPIVDKLIKIFGVKNRSQFNKVFETFQTRAVQGKSKYKVMLEVDATPRQAAAYFRTKPQNKVHVYGRPVYIIEMKKVK